MSENNEDVSVQCPNITVDENDKNVIPKDCKLQGTLSKERDDQKIEEFFLIKSPFIIQKPQKTIDNASVLAKLDTQPPPYKCMVLDFLMDEPPEYGDATGVVVNVNEIVDENEPNEETRTPPTNRKTIKKIWFGGLTFVLVAIGTIVLASTLD